MLTADFESLLNVSSLIYGSSVDSRGPFSLYSFISVTGPQRAGVLVKPLLVRHFLSPRNVSCSVGFCLFFCFCFWIVVVFSGGSGCFLLLLFVLLLFFVCFFVFCFVIIVVVVVLFV